ncbi:MAG: hypothetical protein ACI97A_003687 [Planctomycetota bacterium]|jgi:hypothetical protein
MWTKELRTWAPARCCTREFPPYAFLPGVNPHPRTSPQGHSFGTEHPSEGGFDLAQWRDEERWLFAIDLYNYGYFWESHEYWEAIWHSEGRRGQIATFLKALIQTSAAHIKAIEGNLVGVEILATKSDGMFVELHNEGVFELMGVQLEEFRVRRNNWFGNILVAKPQNVALFPFVHLQGADA